MVIAAPASGSGKTTVATGLIGALRQAGHTVAPFKVGPDFIDPGYHGLAAGRPGRNLDPVLVGEGLIGPLYAHGAGGADIAVIEGVMGLFDGRIGPSAATPAAGSTAHVARLLGAPSSWSSTRAVKARASPRCCTAFRRSTPRPGSPA